MKWGVIGLGKISNTFAKEFVFIETHKIIIAGSRSLDKAKDFCTQYSIPQYGSYEDVVQSPDVDAIYIGTPHIHHYEWIKKSLLAGKHVLCEKSITINAAQYKEVSMLAKAKNLMLMDAMWTYFLPHIVTAKTWVDLGKIGKIKYINADFSFPGTYDPTNRLYSLDLSGGCLLDIGIYPIYLTFLFLGIDYQSMQCHGELADTGIDESVCMILDYGDAKVNLYTSFKHRTLSSAMIYGEKGYIELPLFWKGNTANLFDIEGTLVETYIDTRRSHGFEFEISHFGNCIRDKKAESNIVSHDQTMAVMLLMDEVRKRLGVVYPGEEL